MDKIFKLALIGGGAYMGGKAASSYAKESAKGVVPYIVVGAGVFLAFKAWK